MYEMRVSRPCGLSTRRKILQLARLIVRASSVRVAKTLGNRIVQEICCSWKQGNRF
jgi:hypothetical protein